MTSDVEDTKGLQSFIRNSSSAWRNKRQKEETAIFCPPTLRGCRSSVDFVMAPTFKRSLWSRAESSPESVEQLNAYLNSLSVLNLFKEKQQPNSKGLWRVGSLKLTTHSQAESLQPAARKGQARWGSSVVLGRAGERPECWKRAKNSCFPWGCGNLRNCRKLSLESAVRVRSRQGASGRCLLSPGRHSNRARRGNAWPSFRAATIETTRAIGLWLLLPARIIATVQTIGLLSYGKWRHGSSLWLCSNHGNVVVPICNFKFCHRALIVL